MNNKVDTTAAWLRTFFNNFFIFALNISLHIYLGVYFFSKHSLCLGYSIAAAGIPLILYYFFGTTLVKKLSYGKDNFRKTLSRCSVFALMLSFTYYFLLKPPPGLSQIPLLFWCLLSTFAIRVLLALTLFNLSEDQRKKHHTLNKAYLLAPLVLAIGLSYSLFVLFPIGFFRLYPPAPTVQIDKPLDVLIVGGGFSGIGMGIKLLDVGITNFQIYEKAEQIGGTWWHNTFPGLVVDSPAVMYSYSFAPKYDWSRVRAPQSEIQQYILDTAKRFGLNPYIQTQKKVEKIEFDDDLQLWKTYLADGKSVLSYHVFSATGGLHIPKIPKFKGLDLYQGALFHSAQWNHQIDFKNKRIAVIGSSASAIQIIPELAKVAKRVDMYQRTANWVAYIPNPRISQAQTLARKYVPLYLDFQRLQEFWFVNRFTKSILPLNSPASAKLEKTLLRNMSSILQDPELEKVMTPHYQFGCKRSLVTDNFYQSLNRENVAVISEGIASLNKTGILGQEGNQRDYDVIVMATGYHFSKRDFEIIGPHGQSIDKYIGNPPTTYKSSIAGMPNFYLSTGHNQIINGSVIYPIELSVNYNVNLIRKAGRKHLVSVKSEIQKNYNTSLQKDLQKTMWAGNCKSWYKTKSGHNTTNYPYTPLWMGIRTCEPNYNNFVFEKRKIK